MKVPNVGARWEGGEQRTEVGGVPNAAFFPMCSVSIASDTMRKLSPWLGTSLFSRPNPSDQDVSETQLQRPLYPRKKNAFKFKNNIVSLLLLTFFPPSFPWKSRRLPSGKYWNDNNSLFFILESFASVPPKRRHLFSRWQFGSEMSAWQATWNSLAAAFILLFCLLKKKEIYFAGCLLAQFAFAAGNFGSYRTRFALRLFPFIIMRFLFFSFFRVSYVESLCFYRTLSLYPMVMWASDK